MPRQMGESVVRGLRLEPDLARALRRYAETQALTHGEKVNMASSARVLLREALNVARGEHNCKREGYFAGLREARERLTRAMRG